MITAEVLVVDDNKRMLGILKTLLETEGYAVTCCVDGQSAIEVAKEKDFNVFLVDYRMPAMNGAEAVAVLRRLHPGKRIIGFSIENKEQDFLVAGADLFIRKDELSNRLVEEMQGPSHSSRLNPMSDSGQ
jgi:CheY-like chemotaxis protein